MAKKSAAGEAKNMFATATKDGLSAAAYCGDGSILLAMNLDEDRTESFAGFAIKRTPPKGKASYLVNRINFDSTLTSKAKAEDREWTDSNVAPFQKFRWIDFPKDIVAGEYRYDITAMYFTKTEKLKAGTTVQLAVNILDDSLKRFELGFTRGYLSSQAYAAHFQNKPIRPAGAKTIDFDTAPFADQYEWLGYNARKLVFEALDMALKDEAYTVDAYVYDIDEPDIIAVLQKLGSRLRVFMDNASLHITAAAPEGKVFKALKASAGADNVRAGHFTRFAHNKVLILKKNGTPVKVLAGSANFSVRGLYVQANNIFVFNDETVAALYEQSFEQAFKNTSKSAALKDATQMKPSFARSDIAGKYHDIVGDGLPKGAVAFSPHADPLVSLQRVADAIAGAKSSVLFAIMELSGGGPVLAEIQNLDKRGVYVYGVTQTVPSAKQASAGKEETMHMHNGSAGNRLEVPFSFLDKNVPANFRKEWRGGGGQVVHHKFVVVDFNGENPALFAGSSNLAGGGEKANGDNLVAIYDRNVVTKYAVEALRLLDHYEFRFKMSQATKVAPLQLQSKGDPQPWWKKYYTKGTLAHNERVLLAG